MYPDEKYLVRYKYYIGTGMNGKITEKEESRIQKAQSPEDAVQKARIDLFKENVYANGFTLLDIHKI